ncbi:hypothetical protein EV702DRAFT_113253 [Suillus placidus]|uniref:Uncharacterized protein n=1 Tax=Suillus placidus TaxID=48579 RepID=A0A9P7D4P8_9AGAM|nr:hypothetical protein EV702DRAFT_113253 [Suillus placidus]
MIMSDSSGSPRNLFFGVGMAGQVLMPVFISIHIHIDPEFEIARYLTTPRFFLSYCGSQQVLSLTFWFFDNRVGRASTVMASCHSRIKTRQLGTCCRQTQYLGHLVLSSSIAF